MPDNNYNLYICKKIISFNNLMQFMEVVRLEGHAFSPEDVALARDMYILQVDIIIIIVCEIDFIILWSLKSLS